MATLISNTKSTYGSPYIYYTFSVVETARTSTKVTLKFTVSAKLASSSSFLGSGKNLSAGVYIGGAWHNWSIKSTGTSWSGATSHLSSESFSITVDDDVTKLSNIKVRVRRTDSSGSSGILSAKSISSGISIADSAIFTISYDANGGTGAPSSQTKKYGNTLTLSSTTPSRASDVDDNATTTYTFKGWSTSRTASTATYKAGGKYTKNVSDILYAVWSSGIINKYEVRYVTGCDTIIDKQNKTKGTDLTLSDVVPVKQGYTFKEWNTDEDGSGVTYNVGEVYSTDDDVVLYAIWVAGTHTVVFDANGGSGEPSSFIKTSGINVFISELEPIKSGYDFACWNTASDGSGRSYYPGVEYDWEQVDGTVTLYAQWMSTDILFYHTGECEAVLFVENDDFLGFANNGTVFAGEFIEDSSFTFATDSIHLAEIVER